MATPRDRFVVDEDALTRALHRIQHPTKALHGPKCVCKRRAVDLMWGLGAIGASRAPDGEEK